MATSTRATSKPSTQTRPAIITSGLDVRRGGTIALSGIDLTVPAGTALAVIGPNGSGKSTLLETMTGILKPHSGIIGLDGKRPALVPQTTHVDRSLPITVRETVAMARYATLGFIRPFRRADRLAIDDAIARLEIEELADRPFHELSGGQRQRALVAQGIAQDSEILLLDEPLNGLDVASQEAILTVLDQLVLEGKTVVVTTHDLDDARRYDQVLLLKTKALAVGPPSEVLTATHLREAFGRRFTQVGDELVIDDPHHHHH